MTAMDALNRARAAWEATQPQYVIPGLDDDPLTPPTSRFGAERCTHAGTGIIVEPDRLTSGGEPRFGTGLTANQPAEAAPVHLSLGRGCVAANPSPTTKGR